MNPVYKTFTTLKGFYVYDRSMNSILKIEKEEFDRLNKGDEETILRFRSKGYLADNTIERIRHPDTEHLSYYLQNNVEQIVIQLTQNCNLRCGYCPYMGGYDSRTHTDKTITTGMIQKGIDYLFAHSQNAKEISIGFYGGEPLLEMSLLKKAVEYINEVREGRKVLMTLTTNGTLLSDEIVEYFMQEDIRVVISLDGARESHDANRVFPNGAGSFDIVMEKLKAIKQKYPSYFTKIMINSVISTNNDLSCTNDFFNADQVLEQLMVSMNTVNEYNAKSAIRYSEDFFMVNNFELCKVYLNMLGKISYRQVSKLYVQSAGRALVIYKTLKPYKMQDREAHPGGPCMTGVTRFFMDVEGNLYPCERINEKSEIMRIGHIDSGVNPEKAQYLLNVGAVTEEECKDCFAFNFCRACCASCDGDTELSKEKKVSFCNNTKSTVLEEMRLITMLKEFNYNFENRT